MSPACWLIAPVYPVKVVKRAQLLQAALNNDVELTFAPQTLNRPVARDGGAPQLPASERLYYCAETRERHIADLAREALAKEAPFKPTLDPRSLALAARPRSASVASRPRISERRPDQQPDALAEKRKERELAGCTFAPAVNARSHATKGSGPVQDRLLAAGAVAAARRAQLRATIDSEAQAAATFHPAINHNAASLASRHRTRSHSASATRPSRGYGGDLDEGSSLPAGSSGVSDAGASQYPAATGARLYADAAVMRARLDQRRAELAAAQASHTTFRPAIDPLSRILATRAAPSREGESEAGGEGSSSSPPRVFDRLYAAAFSFADMRAAAVQAALDRELEGVTFQPQILTRSRAIAQVQDRVLSALAEGRDGGGSAAAAAGARGAVSALRRAWARFSFLEPLAAILLPPPPVRVCRTGARLRLPRRRLPPPRPSSTASTRTRSRSPSCARCAARSPRRWSCAAAPSAPRRGRSAAAAAAARACPRAA